jgi:mannose-6-phosphate isomerase-like protein (cupin superfamily)
MSKPVIEEFTPRELGPKPWGRELLVAHTKDYIGKCLWMRAGTAGPLQYHEKKDETFFLFSGEAFVWFHDAEGTMRGHRMMSGESIHVPPGAVHKVEAIDDCVFFESSTPVFDDRVAVP